MLPWIPIHPARRWPLPTSTTFILSPVEGGTNTSLLPYIMSNQKQIWKDGTWSDLRRVLPPFSWDRQRQSSCAKWTQSKWKWQIYCSFGTDTASSFLRGKWKWPAHLSRTCTTTSDTSSWSTGAIFRSQRECDTPMYFHIIYLSLFIWGTVTLRITGCRHTSTPEGGAVVCKTGIVRSQVFLSNMSESRHLRLHVAWLIIFLYFTG